MSAIAIVSVLLAVWLAGYVYLPYDHFRQPASVRGQCLVSFTDQQTVIVYLAWPVFALALLIFFLIRYLIAGWKLCTS